jgi:DnaJ-domain-containing protein 1
VSVSKRIWDLARANLNDFASAFRAEDIDTDRLRFDEQAQASPRPEHAGERAGGRTGDPTSVGEKAGRAAGRAARAFRDAAEEAWEKAYESAQRRRVQAGQPPINMDLASMNRVRWYRTLELPVGAGMDDVRRSYRRLVAQYHPDKYAHDPEKYGAATEVARKITEAYNGLKIMLEREAASRT